MTINQLPATALEELEARRRAEERGVSEPSSVVSPAERAEEVRNSEREADERQQEIRREERLEQE